MRHAYGSNPWTAMLTYGLEAGAASNKEDLLAFV
jgi:hypothetical protein